MKVQELRVGNAVCYNNVLGYVYGMELAMPRKDKRFTGREIVTIFDNGLTTVSEEKLKPILLTEEWHNKFGVVKNGFNQFEYNSPRKNNFNVDILFTGDYVYIRQRILSSRPSHNVYYLSIWNKDLTKRDMYVHEWQNLYFALTGEDLPTI